MGKNSKTLNESVEVMEEIPLHMTWRDVPASEAVEAVIQERVEILKGSQIKILSCNVTISRPHNHSLHGKIYHVEIRLHVPGADICINHEREQDKSHEDVYIAVRDAFNALERKLETYTDKRRGYVKTHNVV